MAGRWEGGSGWRTHVHPWLIHVNVWQKPPRCGKVISFRLKKKKKVWYWQTDRYIDQWKKKIESPEINGCIYVYLIHKYLENI